MGGVEEKARAQPGNELELSGMDFQKEATAIVANAGDLANNSYSSLYTGFQQNATLHGDSFLWVGNDHLRGTLPTKRC